MGMVSGTDNYSMEGYEGLLQMLNSRGFKASTFLDSSEKELKVFLRHDVDADLEAAVAMAELECNLGIRSTYFLMLTSPLYNLLNNEFARLGRRLVSLGHAVGLHYDENYNSSIRMNSSDTSLDIQAQAALIGKLLACEIKAVSFHQPSSNVLKSPPETHPLANAYDFLGKADSAYVSDSNRREGFMEDILSFTMEGPKRVKSLQILIHPMWWYYKDQDCSGVWDNVIKSSMAIGQNQLVRTERAFGPRRNISLTLSRRQETGC